MKGACLLIKELERQGVDYIFGYPGGAIMPVYLDRPPRPGFHRPRVGPARTSPCYGRRTRDWRGGENSYNRSS